MDPLIRFHVRKTSLVGEKTRIPPVQDFFAQNYTYVEPEIILPNFLRILAPPLGHNLPDPIATTHNRHNPQSPSPLHTMFGLNNKASSENVPAVKMGHLSLLNRQISAMNDAVQTTKEAVNQCAEIAKDNALRISSIEESVQNQGSINSDNNHRLCQMDEDRRQNSAAIAELRKSLEKKNREHAVRDKRVHDLTKKERTGRAEFERKTKARFTGIGDELAKLHSMAEKVQDVFV